MAKANRSTALSLPRCVNCHDPLGDRAGVLPVSVPEDDGDGAGKVEQWCPQCFVFHRARLDRRWVHASLLGRLLAIRCTACKVTSLDVGRGCCGQCGSRIVVALGPKPVIS